MKGEILGNTNLHFIAYYDNKGELITSLWTVNPPHYKTGEVLLIAPRVTSPNFPLKKNITAEIKEIFHSLELSERNSTVEYVFKLDITLDVEL